MEEFTFSFEKLIKFFRMQQGEDYEGIDAIISLYDTTTLTGIRRQYAITAILIELGLNPTQNDDEGDNKVEEVDKLDENKRTFSIGGSYQIIVCKVMNQYVTFNVFPN